MDLLIDVILRAGRSAVELSFFILLPVMIVMISLMRLLEARGVLDWVVARLAPLLRPAGLTGLGVFAALQINLVTANAAITKLSQLNGVEGIAVQNNPFTNSTVINFGADADGTVISVTLAGIVDPALVNVTVI